jgi:hypothetical protein
LGDEEEPVLVRAESYATKQVVLGIAMPIEDARWPEQSEWEMGLYGTRRVAKKRTDVGGERRAERRR